MFEYTTEPYGPCPTQGEGIITETGQGFYFRHRGGRVSLTISVDERPTAGREGDARVARYFETTLVWDQEAALPLPLCNGFVEAWVTQYLAERVEEPTWSPLAAIQESLDRRG